MTDLTAHAPSEPVVRLTQDAADHIKSMLEEQAESAGKTLRVFVEKGGCSGMQYGMVFDQLRDGDRRDEFYGVAVLVDPVSAEHLRGTVIDFVDAIQDGGFKISNPLARQSCGCGRSFES